MEDGEEIDIDLSVRHDTAFHEANNEQTPKVFHVGTHSSQTSNLSTTIDIQTGFVGKLYVKIYDVSDH